MFVFTIVHLNATRVSSAAYRRYGQQRLKTVVFNIRYASEVVGDKGLVAVDTQSFLSDMSQKYPKLYCTKCGLAQLL